MKPPCPEPWRLGVALGNPGSTDDLVFPMILPQAIPERIREAPVAACAHAWLLPLPAWRPHWLQLAPLVMDAQRLRFATIRDAARRRDRLLAAALHRWVLAQALGLAPDHLPLYRSHTGQPRLALPALHTSLAHCDGMVAVALCEGGPVGVDVEKRDTASLDPIRDLVCAPGEAVARQAPGGDDDARLLSLWVRKEAVLKALGLGLARPMDSFAAPDGGRLALRDVEGERVELEVRGCEDAGDCVAALAAPAGMRHRWIWKTP